MYDACMALERAGCIAVEMECVPARVAAEITRRTKMLVFSMGSGPDCDGQFIFSEDILGTQCIRTGHYPRHAYRARSAISDGSEKLNMMQQAIKALSEYVADVKSGAYPSRKNTIQIKDGAFDAFMQYIGSNVEGSATWLR